MICANSIVALLTRISTDIGWPAAHAYHVDASHPLGLYPGNCWYLRDAGRCHALVESTRRTAEPGAIRASRGTGLPRRVAGSGRPVWIPDLLADPRFLRARLSEAPLGVNCAFAIPLLRDGEVTLVLEFFGEQPQELDESKIKAALSALPRALLPAAHAPT
jgi:hypothetical protein